jgi:hypothetical protein
MTTSLRSAVETHLGWTWRDQVGNAAVVDSNRLAFDLDLPDGDDAGEADAVWHVQNRTLSEGESLLLQLDALEQPLFGDTILVSMDRVKAILIVNRNTEGAAYLLVGGAPADEWSEPFGMAGDTVKVMPGSPLLLANVLDGWPVAAGGATLRLASVGGSVRFDIAILGTLPASAAPSG